MIKLKSEPRVFQNPNPAVPLAALVQFEAEAYLHTKLTIDNGDCVRTLTFDANDDVASGLPILGMHEGQALKISVEIVGKDGDVLGPFHLSYTAPMLLRDSLAYPCCYGTR